MSVEVNGISTIKEAWKNAACEEERPETIPSEYTDERALPNITSILNACKVTINPSAIYETNLCVKYSDLLVEARTLQFTLKGLTTIIGTYVNVEPSMISTFSLNGEILTSEQLTSYYLGDGIYKISGYLNAKVNVIIHANYEELSITYKEYTEESTYKAFNGKLVLLRNIDSHPLAELKYGWTVNGRDIDLNFFVIKNTDGVHSLVGMFGFKLAISSSNLTYYPVPITAGTNTFPESGCDFCLSLDVDNRGTGNLTEILSIYPVDMTWTEIMQNYDFVYAALDYYKKGDSMVGMTVKLSSDDFPVSKEISLETTAEIVNSWMICRFGSTTNGLIVEYKTDTNESLVYDSNLVLVSQDITLVGISLTIKQGSLWNS